MNSTNRFKKLLCVAGLSLTAMGAQADLLDDIKDRGEIVIATEARYEPFEMLQDGKIVGYGKDILDEILKDLPGVELKQLDLPFQGILAGLNAERYDFVATSLMMTQKRLDAYAFTNPIADASLAMLKRKGDDSINSPEDMAGKVAGVQAGSAQLTGVREYEKTVLEPKGESVKDIKEFTDYNEAYAALASRRVDFVPQAIPNLAPIVKKRPDMFELVQPAFGPTAYYGWAGRKDDDSKRLVEFFNQGLLKLQQSGKLEELQQKWFGFTMELPEGELPTPAQ
ncbi:transporter substrate-binding domain-containing protein [Marinobacterium mangrovicola]|uniref:Amino acid ABC transporter substrate-binding protein (PAAT family) n=1 Tax=Marinobacterium mangrovicola TaxID=1476959 RepID=A0A4R1GRM5_9GAMM|nr:transporter substrate-binding domain-containing protein [Marinobacterium mangrovicola]TCK07182.1 amino acid ABC transporter substrate-binding protein (PAAT family) [Marinobacterium mangrovicola]